MYVYSSGSIQAQKLLFGQSLVGDLLRFIDGHFDTSVGVKQDPKSYEHIVDKIGCKPEEVLFLTDIVKGELIVRNEAMFWGLNGIYSFFQTNESFGLHMSQGHSGFTRNVGLLELRNERV